MCLLLMAVILAAGAVDLDREGRDPAYVESIVKRSQKIVDKLELKDAEMAQHVTHIIANRYFKLNDIYEVRDAKVKQAKETLTVMPSRRRSKRQRMRRMRHCIAVILSFRLPCRSIWTTNK